MAFFGKLPKFNHGMSWAEVSCDQMNNLVEVVEQLRKLVDNHTGSAGSGGISLTQNVPNAPSVQQRKVAQGTVISLAKFKGYGTAGGYNIIKVRRIDSAGNETDTVDQDCYCYVYGASGTVDIPLSGCAPKYAVNDILRVYVGTKVGNAGLIALDWFVDTCT